MFTFPVSALIRTSETMTHTHRMRDFEQ